MIALDAMGGDYAPQATVRGALQAVKKGVSVLLVGDQAKLIALLDAHEAAWRSLPLVIEHAGQEIDMGEEPGRAVVRKKDSSLMRAMDAVASGRAQAVVSAGNSGAALVGATLVLGRVPGVLRPAIGEFLPKVDGSQIFCLDLGANTDCKPEYLLQFAHMGQLYVKLVHGIANPAVALLSNGAEPYKGNQSVKKAYELLEKAELNFVGNIESRYIFDAPVQVLVCDGFVGNVLLKGIQGTARAVSSWLKQEAHRSWWSKLYFALGAPIFKRLKDKTDYSKKGGALLLGVKRPVFIAHGSSSANAIEHALIKADELVKQKILENYNMLLQARFASYAPEHDMVPVAQQSDQKVL